MHGGSLLLTCMPYVASPKAYITLLHACALSFPECSYILLLFPGTNYHICIVITHAAWISVGLLWGPRWSLVTVGVVPPSVLSMNSGSFLPYVVMSWVTEMFVNFSGSWCLLVYLHFFRMCLLHVLWGVLA